MPLDELPSEPSLPVVPGYELLTLVGRGGMGRVYKAVHLGLGRTVAIKLLTATDDDDQLARFREEARAVAHLQHPNIVQVFESGTVHSQPYFSQEFLEGGSLAAKLREGPLSPEDSAALLEIVARAIHHSHTHGVLHRDLKPANILLAADGTPKVSDFGLAKRLDRETNLTRTGEILGTPAYMAPEQASGVANDVGPAADIYALGALLYELLTGRPPFQGPDALQTVMLVLTMDPVSPRALQPNVPKDLETICLKCLEKSPKKRYATADDLAEDLRRFRTNEAIVARPVGLSERSLKWARRHKAGAALIGALTMLFVVTVVSATLLAFGYFQLDKALTDTENANTALGEKNTELQDTNQKLAKSQQETEAILNYTLETMDEYHFAMSDKLKNLPQGEKLRIEVLQQARDSLDKLYKTNTRRERVQEYLMHGYSQLGNALNVTGDATGAEVAYRRSREVADKLATTFPDIVSYRVNKATTGLQLAHTLELLGREKEAEPLRDECEKDAVTLEAAHPKDFGVLQLSALAYSRPAIAILMKGDAEQNEAVFRRWADLYRRMAEVRPDQPRFRRDAIEWDLKVAGNLAQRNKLKEAEAILAEAKREVDQLPETTSREVRQMRAAYHEAVGSVNYWANKPAEADAAYRRALAEYDTLVKDFPNSPNIRRGVVNVWYSLGGVWTYGGKPPEGLVAYRKARELAAELVKEYPKDQQMKGLLDGIDATIRSLTPEKK